MTGTPHEIQRIRSSGDARIDGLLSNSAWAEQTITYGFADAQFMRQLVGYGSGENAKALATTVAMENAVRFALDTDDGNPSNDGFSLEGFTAAQVQGGHATDGHIRIAQTASSSVGVTAWAYFPSWSETGGDIWFSTARYDFTSPRAGNYAWLTSIHELGHALGLEHGHEGGSYGPLPAAMDSHEFSIMTYRSYTGGETRHLTNDDWSYPQTPMMLDIAALQHIYGADFDTNAGDTVYRWAPAGGQTFVDAGVGVDPGANVIFATIWDGGGTDRYDLTAYGYRPQAGGILALFGPAARDAGPGGARGRQYLQRASTPGERPVADRRCLGRRRG